MIAKHGQAKQIKPERTKETHLTMTHPKLPPPQAGKTNSPFGKSAFSDKPATVSFPTARFNRPPPTPNHLEVLPSRTNLPQLSSQHMTNPPSPIDCTPSTWISMPPQCLLRPMPLSYSGSSWPSSRSRWCLSSKCHPTMTPVPLAFFSLFFFFDVMIGVCFIDGIVKVSTVGLIFRILLWNDL